MYVIIFGQRAGTVHVERDDGEVIVGGTFKSREDVIPGLQPLFRRVVECEVSGFCKWVRLYVFKI